MDPLFRLETMLPDFAYLFKHNNFNCFRTFIKDVIGQIHYPVSLIILQILV